MQVSLVAGGAGFIGSHLCEQLLNEGYQVICIDNLITGDKKNIDSLLRDSKFQFIEHDVTDSKPGYRLQIPKLDYIFHLASPASPSKKNPKSYISLPIETMLVNSVGTYNLLSLSRENSAKFLFASTSEVYGDPLTSPQDETYFGNVNPVGVRSVYDEGKRFGEAMTMAYFRKYNSDCRIIRIFNTYGPKMCDDGRVITNFINQAINNKPITIYGTGSQTRSFCYVSDMIKGLISAMINDDTKGQVINLGNPDEQKILEIAKIIKRLTNSLSEIVYEELPQDDPKRRKPDITLAKELLKWEPGVDLEEGLKKTIGYFKK